MASPGPFRRWRDLGAVNRRLLAEALPALILASVAIRLVPFRRLADRASRRGSGGGTADEAYLRKLRWAVDAWGKRVPWRALCFERGLAVHQMLHRRGISSVLHYGVAREGEGGIAAHVWVTVGGRAVIGGEEAPRFTCLATFPSRTEPPMG
jgi:hypothetical protein